MLKLNFPEFKFETKKIDGNEYIYDNVRKKWVLNTPEEFVRQHVINYFIYYLNYPKNLLSIEKTITVNKLKKRFDIVVFSNFFKPLIIVECKAPTVKISDEELNQAVIYNTVLNSKIIFLTNGINHYIIRTTPQTHFLSNFPSYRELLEME